MTVFTPFGNLISFLFISRAGLTGPETYAVLACKMSFGGLVMTAGTDMCLHCNLFVIGCMISLIFLSMTFDTANLCHCMR
jgi:hypothetical protein